MNVKKISSKRGFFLALLVLLIFFLLILLVYQLISVSESSFKSIGAKYFQEKYLKDYIKPVQKKIDVLNYKIAVDLYPDREAIAGSTEITGIINGGDVNSLILNFHDDMEITDLILNGNTTEYEHDDVHLTIPFNGEVRDTFNLLVSYSGTPDNLGFGSFSFGEYNDKSVVYTLNEPVFASTWFPCNDRPDDKASLEISITNDSSKVSVSNGKLLEVVSRGKRKTYRWKTHYPISTYLISIYSADYEKFGDTFIFGKDTMDIGYYVFPEHRNDAEIDFSVHPEILEVLSSAFGKYPFIKEKYGVAVFLWQKGAMENQTITGIGSKFIGGNKFFTDIYVHEAAHQWWGNAVGPATWKDIWLNEGFATYSEALYYEKISGKDAYISTLLSKKSNDFPGTLYDPKDNFFGSTVYNKGAWVLHMLRNKVGDSTFFEILRHFYQRFKYKNASTKDFQDISELIAKEDLKKFFDQWVYEGEGIIKLRYNLETNRKNDSLFTNKLHIKQVQDGYEAYHFPLEFTPINENEKKMGLFNYYLTSRDTTLVFESKIKPVDLKLDPNYKLLARFENSGEQNAD